MAEQKINELQNELQNKKIIKYKNSFNINRGGSTDAATFKMESFLITVNGWKALTIITKHSILNDAAALDPPLINIEKKTQHQWFY